MAQRAVRIVAEGAGSVTIDVTGRDATGGRCDASGDHPVSALIARHGPAADRDDRRRSCCSTATPTCRSWAMPTGCPALLYRAPPRARDDGDRRERLAGRLCLYRAAGQAIAAWRWSGPRRAGRGWCMSARCNPLDDHYGLGSSRRGRPARSRSTMRRRAGTRRCSTMQRGRAGALVYDPGEPGATLTPRAVRSRLKAEMEAELRRHRAMRGGRCCSRAGSAGRHSA